jgi:hypothetical protein
VYASGVADVLLVYAVIYRVEIKKGSVDTGFINQPHEGRGGD